MAKKLKSYKPIWCIAVVLLLLAGGGQAAEIKGVKFSDRVKLDQLELNLTGVAVLKWGLLFDVYAGAFYLPADHPERFWTDDVPKRLELSYFRKIKAADFADSSDKLLKRNLTEEEYSVLADRLKDFLRLFRDVRPGDRYSLNYQPGSGTELRLNEEPLGSAPGADFAVAYFGIWLGEQPINESFRDRLLGE